MLKFSILLSVFASTSLLENVENGIVRNKRQNAADNTIIEQLNNCKCVFYYQCDANNTIITNGINLINVRFNDPTEETDDSRKIICNGGKFENELICCKTKNNSTAVTNSPKPFEEVNAKKAEHECGMQRPKINIRILIDETSDDDVNPVDGEFPWITAIYKKNNKEKWVFCCSGALIHPKVVLTANHYFHRKHAQNFKIILTGNIELSAIGDDNMNERNVTEIVNHPQYYGGALYNDASLLILDKPFESTTTNSINSICLPPDGINMDSGRCLVAGWGKGSTENDKQVLKKVDLPIVPFNQCQDQLQKTRLGKGFILHDSFMCAGGEKNKDACKGDGGSPLMCLLPGETRYFHMGIVSWGIGCGSENVPGVYASIVKLKSWIIEELKKKDIRV